MPSFKIDVTKRLFLTATIHDVEDEEEAEMLVNDALLGDPEAEKRVEFDPNAEDDFIFESTEQL